MTKVSIIVPIYNVEKYVENCLTSLINQTFEDIEVLAISDGSPDNSESIVKEMMEKDNRIKYYYKDNGGYGSVLEYAINMIDSKYFLICDPDDWLEPCAIEKLYTLAEKNDLDITIGEKYTFYLNEEENKFVSKRLYMNYEIIPGKIYTDDISKFSFLPVTPHSKLYNTYIAKNIKFPHHVCYTDLLLYMLSLMNSKKIMYVEVPLSNYLIDRPGNSATEKKPKAIGDHIVVWESIYNNIDMNDKYFAGRMFEEYKRIINVYINNSDNYYKDEYFNKLNNIRKLLSDYYINIKSIKELSFKEKIILYLLLKSKISLKKYISIKLCYKRISGR